MKKYIEFEAAMSFPFANGQYDHENADPHFINGCKSYREWLEAIPAADVKPVVRGHWIEWRPGDCTLIMTGDEMLWMCSECESKHVSKSRYCPNCGAKMDKEVGHD